MKWPLMEAATRGDGDTGENITHNVLGISGIPDKIPYKERLVVTGEAFIRPSDFEALKDTLRDGNGEPYKTGVIWLPALSDCWTAAPARIAV